MGLGVAIGLVVMMVFSVYAWVILTRAEAVLRSAVFLPD